jgi:hypothetical protein
MEQRSWVQQHLQLVLLLDSLDHHRVDLFRKFSEVSMGSPEA